jgi:hypothetical protein
MRAALAVSLFALCSCCACRKRDAGPTPAVSARVAASAEVAPSAQLAPTVPHSNAPKGACRALAVTGKASADGTPIAVGTLLDGEHWVELEENSSVALRHTITSRELKLLGPGLVLPCRHGSEQFLLARGRLSTSSNLGVRPGAEVLLATPAASIHYGDASLDLQFDKRGLHLRVNGGEAWLDPAEPDPKTPPKNPLRTKQEARVPVTRADPSGLAGSCKSAAENAAESARRVLAGATTEAGESLGARAAAQMRDRAAARAACAVAAAAAGALSDPAERQSLWASIAHSDELWQSVPRAISAQKN